MVINNYSVIYESDWVSKTEMIVANQSGARKIKQQ